MKQKLAQDIALMRYSMISPLIVGLPDEYKSKEAYFRAASARGALHPNGSFIHPAPTSIKRWYQHYQKNGFDGLLPSSRSDEGTSRKIHPDLEEQIRYLKTNYPRMSAAAIFRQLCDNGSVNRNELSESTVNRFLNSLARKERTTNNQDMRRYERAHVNEVWCGDSSVGPYLKTEDGRKHKVYVIALIDDASRYIVGIDVFFNDNFANLMSVMKSAVAKFGVPKLFNFDNGSSYKNRQMDLLAARIGSAVHYDQRNYFYRLPRRSFQAAPEQRPCVPPAFPTGTGLSRSALPYARPTRQKHISAWGVRSPGQKGRSPLPHGSPSRTFFHSRFP